MPAAGAALAQLPKDMFHPKRSQEALQRNHRHLKTTEYLQIGQTICRRLAKFMSKITRISRYQST
jgi:hypothetical protein